MPSHLPPLALFAITSAAIAASILVAYLIFRPRLRGATKLWLLLGLGVFPILTAGAGNLQGFEATKQRTFCASCHLMTLHTADSDNLASQTLSARHAKNRLFGSENCYVCHADYGMYGTIVTKMGGMMHVYNYYLGGYREMPIEVAKRAIHVNKPYPNTNCMQCHSSTATLWLARADHKAALGDVREGRMSCASEGCHGVAHPYWHAADGGAP